MREKAVWMDGVFCRSLRVAAERLSASLGRKVGAKRVWAKLKAGGGRFVMGGVEVSDRPCQRAESPSEEPRPEKRRPLLNRRALDFGLSKPSWFA
jgi:hypothetical protein